MSSVSLVARGGHIPRILGDLLRCGWTLETVPESGNIPRNGLKLILKANDRELKLRIFAYKVTTSGRNRPDERRVEITTTYQGTLRPLKGFRDVVLGVDVASGKYVGIDSRRLSMGGPTHNASSFFDLEGLSVKSGELWVNPRNATSPVFPSGIELHAFFDRERLSEYLFNEREIHVGSYSFGGAFSRTTQTKKRSKLPATVNASKAKGETVVLSSNMKTRRTRIRRELIEAFEEENFTRLRKKKVTPEQLKRIMKICEEIGALGEQAVLASERRRLRKLGFPKKAAKVERVSLRSVGEGYDILSFENDGVTRRYLEVKATIGNSPVINVSRGEWRTAKKYGSRYYFVRVTEVRDAAKMFFVRNPASLERKGLVSMTATGWKVDLSSALKPAP